MSQRETDPELTRPEISNRLAAGAISFFERRYDTATAHRVVDVCGLPLDWFDDRGQWVSQRWIERFIAAVATQLFDESGIPERRDHPMFQLWRDMGVESWQPEALGPLYTVIRAFGSPSAVYHRLPGLAVRGNRSLRLRVAEASLGRIVYVLDLTNLPPGVRHALEWNVMGSLEGLPTIWDLPPATVHASRAPDGSQARLDVLFDERLLTTWVRLLAAPAVAGALAAVGGALLGDAAHAALGGVAAGALTLSALALRWLRAGATTRRAEAERLESAFAETDRHVNELWNEQLALRRSLLASRKLSGYLAQDLVEQILSDPDLDLELGGRRTEAAILFTDLVSYTSRCEASTPEVIVEELNLYFGFVDPAFTAHGGIIDKRMGDGIMAVFPASRGKDPGGRAVRCALDILRRLDGCNRALAERGRPPLAMRVGVAAGPLVQGNMGSEVKLEYTVVGDVVNLAARLESEATPGRVMAAESCLAAVPGDARVTARREVRVKGVSSAITVVELEPGS